LYFNNSKSKYEAIDCPKLSGPPGIWITDGSLFLKQNLSDVYKKV